MPDRLRRLIAGTLDLLPGQCGDSLGRWARRQNKRTSPWSPNQTGCRAEATTDGQCLCGKLRGPFGGARGGPR